MAKVSEFCYPKYFFEIIFFKYKESCTHELFGECTRAIGISFFEEIEDGLYPSKIILFGNREEETIVFEELCGNQELADFYDLVNSPL